MGQEYIGHAKGLVIGGHEIGISGFTLKCIAMITMFLDHLGAVLFPGCMELRMVGRISFPIYCFLLVEGAVHTSNIRRYEARLFAFALVSEIPFDLAFFDELTLGRQNVFFTLLIGLLAIDASGRCKSRVGRVCLYVLAVFAAEVFHTDYVSAGVLFILCFYWFYDSVFAKQAAFAALNWFAASGNVQKYAGFSVFPLLLYNGRRGPSMKYFFYVFYPLHLLILFFVKHFILTGAL